MASSAHVDTFAADNLPPRSLWPDLLLDRPEYRYPERLNCVAALLDAWALSPSRDDPCLLSRDGTLSYAQLHAEVNRIANVLVREFDLVPGERVLLRSGNSATMVACYLAVMKAGGIAVATMPLLRAREIAYPLAKAEIALALCDFKLSQEMEAARAAAPKLRHVVYWNSNGPGSLERLAREASPCFAPVDTAADDVCLIGFTSGTTGEPKGTMHFHRDILAICDGYAHHVVGGTRTDRFVSTAPLAFTFGLAGVLFPMRVGATAIVLEKAAPAELGQAIEDFKATICFTAPTGYRQLMRANNDLSSLRRCISAGEALSLATYEAWLARTGLKLIDGIGGTEMLHIYLSSTEDDLVPGSTGRPVPGFEAKIVDANGVEVPPNTVGRLAVRGPLGCRYLADPRQAKYVQNGWNMPGDTFRMDERGYFWYQARDDDMIVSSGYNIAAPEVEDSLQRHPAVAECAVIGVDDEARGHIVKAFIVLAQGFEGNPALAEAIQAFVKADIAPYKYPRQVAFVDALPKTASGKIQRFALRSLETGAVAVAS